MNVYSRTLPLPGAVRPVREQGACAQERSAAEWPPPRSVAHEPDNWGAPVGPAVQYAVVAPWPAPDPVMCFDLPAPDLGRTIAPPGLAAPEAELAPSRQLVSIPSLQTASMAALAPPSISAASRAVWPAPTPDDMGPAVDDRTRFTSRLVIGLAVAVGAAAAGAAALVSLF